MPRRRDGWPEKAREEQYLDAQRRYILLTSEVFEKEWGQEWYTLRSAKAHSTIDLSGRSFYLETLTGEPEKGLFHPGVHREHVEVLNVSKNQLTDISCLNNKTDGSHDFRNLQILNASRNMLTEVRLELGNLTMLNLSYNELLRLPSLSQVRELQKLVLSHNHIDGTLREFMNNPKLWYLDLSSNQFSWRPSLFKEQLDVLEHCHIRELKLWPNPFADYFKEYQFLTVTALDSLTSLDGFFIDHDLRAELRVEADKLRAKSVDYTIFDIKVEQKKKIGAPVEDTGADIVGSNVPRMSELIGTLNKILDRPDELNKHINTLEEKVKGVWGAHYQDRRQLMEVLASAEDRDLGRYGAQAMTPEEEKQAVNEFSDKMQQVLERNDSVQDVLVMCLVRLTACGNGLVSQRSAKLLAEWIDASAAEFHGRIGEVSRVLFRDLTIRALAGMQSINESPFECYEATHGRMGEDENKWGRMDNIAECACIMRALSCFGSSAIFSKADSPYRALMLQPLLPALCRASHTARGPDRPPDEWSSYPDFDAFADETAETMDVPEGNLPICQERCARLGYGGFVLEESPDQPSMQKAMFKRHLPDALSGMRVAYPGRTLHVRPSRTAKALKRAPDSSEAPCEAWTAWINGVAVLAVATADKFNAAQCVSAYGTHAAICRHDTDSAGFTEAWMLVTEDATRGFVLMLRVMRNLTRAAAPHGQEANRYFMEHKLHTNCWNRARRRLMENGAAIPMSRLNESKSDFTLLISSLVSVICAMNEAGPPEVSDAVMTDLKASGLDVFDLLLEVCAYAGVPDPVLLATSLEMIYTFLESSVTRSTVLARVLNRLHDSAILLPYIKGPKVNDVNNLQYQELWRVCMVRYGGDNLAQERMPELFVSANDFSTSEAYGGQARGQAERSKWRARVPELKDLQHPLMHRVLLGIVRLIQLFSLNSQNDATGLLKNVATLLDEQGRERLLIGPATGLVMCPDFDVKIQCLKVIEHVLETSPQQLSAEEMGWLLQYLTSSGLGIGKQEEFLMEVLQLIILLISDETKAGHTFRQKFTKFAIREAFEILRLNCRRETKGEAEEASKKSVSMRTIKLLQVCSRPMSGGLRKFLRRVDFLTCLKEIILEEDRHDRPSVRAALLSTWTGRNMREVLLPLAAGSETRPRGRSRYRVLVRLADVLQGRSDHGSESSAEVLSFDEKDFWPSISTMSRIERDSVELEDWMAQQQQFVSSAGISQIMSFADRYLQGEVCAKQYRVAQSLVEAMVDQANQNVKRWWEDQPKSSKEREAGEDLKHHEIHLSPVEECFMTKLRIVNQRVSELFHYNLNVYDEKRGSSLVKLAKDLAKHFTENQETHRKLRNSCYDDYVALEQRKNEYLVGSRLVSIETAIARRVRIEKPRQPHGDLKRLMEQAATAQQNLKQALLARHPQNDKDAEEWARTPLDKGKEDVFRRRIGPKGLVTFLRNYDAQVIDPGTELQDTILRRHKFKYFNDNTRVRSAVRLIIEYPDATKLRASLAELMHCTLFSVVKIRNRFALPSNFGRRYVIVNVELQQLGESKHICQLELVIRNDLLSPQDTLARENGLMETLEKSLRDCQVKKPKEVEKVAEFLVNELESRSVRHGDAIILQSDERNLEVQKEDVFAQSSAFSSNQVFIIEREEGMGVVKAGDVVSLKSKNTGNYLDMTSNGQMRCRFPDVQTQQSNLRFVVEIELLYEPRRGVAGGLAGWFGGGDVSGGNEGHAQRGAQLAPVTNLHSRGHVRLKSKGSPRYITVMPGATYLGLGGEKQRVKGQAPEDNFTQSQLLEVIREGSMTEHLKLDGSAEGEGHADTIAVLSPEEKQEQRLLEAHMCVALPSLDASPAEGGLFRRTPPAFKVVARRQAQGDGEHDPTTVNEDRSSMESEFSRMPLVMAAVVRCFYSLVELPDTPSTQHYALDEIMAATKGCKQIVHYAMTVQLAFHSDTFEEEPDIVSAWMPAKLLRLFSAALSHAPALCIPAGRSIFRETEGCDPREREKAIAREHKKEDRGEYDQQRITFLEILAQYMSRMLVQPLLVRLSVVAQRTLSVQEVVLLREFAVLTDRMVFNFFSNELRCAKKPQHQPKSQLPALANVEESTQAAVAVIEANLDEKSSANLRLSPETESEIFAALVPRAATHVLVHAMLFAMHQEAIAFTSGFVSSSLTVRLISSLANRSMGALAAVMQGRSGSEHTACEFHVCEAVSQAMSNGAQLVPRARVTQLMEERAVDKLRGVLEGMMKDGAFTSPVAALDDSVARPKPTERIMVVARCWAGPVDDKHLTLPRCVVAITSRLNLAVVLLPPDATSGSDAVVGGAPPQADDLLVVSFRDLRKLQFVVVHPKMRQFLALWWDDSEATSREVLIFDSASRRRAFQQALRMVEKVSGDRSREAQRGVPQVHLRREVIDALQETCKKDSRTNTALVNATFVRSRTNAAAASWGESWGQSNHAQAEVLLLTADTICAVSLTSFLQQFTRPDDAQAYASQPLESNLMETDSEEEDDASQTLRLPNPVGEGIVKSPTLYGSPWLLKTLQGVWFLAETEPKIKLGFEKPEYFLFSSDGERQRWRRHLAFVLASQERRQLQDDRRGNQGWSVVATGKTEIGEVRQYAMTHAHRALGGAIEQQTRAVTDGPS